MQATGQTKQARQLVTGDVFLRWARQYTVVANEKGTGGRGRSILADAISGERVVIPIKATESVEVRPANA